MSEKEVKAKEETEPDLRMFMIAGVIDEETVGGVFGWIIELIEKDRTKPASLYINRMGGSGSDALAIYDFIKNCDIEIDTHALGSCQSAALIVLQAGKKRYAHRYTNFMWHSGRGKISEYTKAVDIAAYSEWVARSNRDGDEVLRRHTKIPRKIMKQAEMQDMFFDAKQALAWGVCDEIIGGK